MSLRVANANMATLTHDICELGLILKNVGKASNVRNTSVLETQRLNCRYMQFICSQEAGAGDMSEWHTESVDIILLAEPICMLDEVLLLLNS